MVIDEWAKRWGVSVEALEDLRRELGAVRTDPDSRTGGSEADVQVRVRLEASRKGSRLFRNNVGACYTSEGSFIRYGLANDSKKMNDKLKSSDLIGIRPTVILPGMVGATIGQFLAREVKRPGWKYTGTKREQAQLNFLDLIASLGGDARFITEEGSI